MILSVIKAPDPVLSLPSKPVEKIDKKLRKLIRDMKETLLAARDPQGVGLAAPQVGVAQSFFIMRKNHGESDEMDIFINPKIIKKTTKENLRNENEPIEGCLSVDRIWSPIVRPNHIEVEYMDIHGKTHKKTFSGFEAIIIQHEVDHLNGILFTTLAMEQNVSLYEERGKKLYEIEL
ncbi:peptide deformylase [Candidatus Woesebacteria bacterium]|nr:peptide deformylase [Candidatus Woesebacteria bacterium]